MQQRPSPLKSTLGQVAVGAGGKAGSEGPGQLVATETAYLFQLNGTDCAIEGCVKIGSGILYGLACRRFGKGPSRAGVTEVQSLSQACYELIGLEFFQRGIQVGKCIRFRSAQISVVRNCLRNKG